MGSQHLAFAQISSFESSQQYDSFWEIVTFYFQRNLCTLSVTSHLNQFVFTQIWSALVYYVAGELNDVEARRPTYVASAGPLLLLLLQPDLRD